MIKRLVLMLLAVAVVFGGIFGWKFYKAMQMARMAGVQPPATVSSTTVERETWQERLEAVGTVVAVNGINVTSEVAGVVDAIHFQSGGTVEKGTPLLTLDDSVDQAELADLTAAHKLAQAEFARAEKLFKNGDIPASDFDQAEARLEQAKAQLAAKQAVIRKKHVRAPFSGVLGIRQINVGEYLEPGASIVPLQTLDPVYVDFTLPEHRFARVSAGQTVSVVVRSYPERTFTGRVEAVNPGVDPSTRNFRVRALLENPQDLLRPGMFATVRVLLPERHDVLTLPRTAVTYDPYGDSVFRISENEAGEKIVRRVQIKTGVSRGGRVEILSGLESGQSVVSAGQIKLRNGQRVTIDNSVQLEPQTVELLPQEPRQ